MTPPPDTQRPTERKFYTSHKGYFEGPPENAFEGPTNVDFWIDPSGRFHQDNE